MLLKIRHSPAELAQLNQHQLTATIGLITLLLLALHPALSRAADDDGPTQTGARVDSLGDPLPKGARLRLGTSRFRPPSGVDEIALSPDNKSLVTFGRQIIVWNATTGEERWKADQRNTGFMSPGAAYGLKALSFAPEGSCFYTPGRQNEIIAWDLLTGAVGPQNNRANQAPIGPDNVIRSVDIAPDGKTAAVGSPTGVAVYSLDGTFLFEIANQPKQPLKFDNKDRLTFHGDYSYGVFSPDGKVIAVVTSDAPQTLRLCQANDGKEMMRIAVKAKVVRLAFSPDGKQIATTERDCAARLYDAATGKEVWSHVVKLDNPYENYTSAIAFSPDGKTLAVAATDCQIHLLEPSTGEEAGSLTGHSWYPWALAFTSDSKMLYSSGWEGAIRRWNVASRKQLGLPKGISATGVVSMSPDGLHLVYADDGGTLRLVNPANGKEQRTFELPGIRYSQLSFSPDNRQLSGGGSSDNQVHVAVWNVDNGELLHHWRWPKGRDPHSTVESLAFSPGGSRLAAAVFRQSTAYLWDLKTDQQIAGLPHKQVYGLSFSPNGETLATAGWDSNVRFWASDTGQLRNNFDVKKSPETDSDLRMYAVCYSPEGGLIATAHLDGMVRVWRADEMVLRSKLQVPGRFVYGALNFSPDGLWLATGGMDGTLGVWDPLTAQCVWDVGRHQGHAYTVGFGRDDKSLVSGGEDGVCYLWDLKPSVDRPNNDPHRLWDDIAGDDSLSAFQSMWILSSKPEQSIKLLADALKRIEKVIDIDRTSSKISVEDARKQQELLKRLDSHDKSVARAITIRRAISVLAQLGTVDALDLLKELSQRAPNEDVRRLATAALERSGPPSSR
jgi:WD40 repeat protein